MLIELCSFHMLCVHALRCFMHCAEHPVRPTAVHSCNHTFQSSSAVARALVKKQRRRCVTAALQQHDFTGTRGELFVDYQWGSRSVVVTIAACLMPASGALSARHAGFGWYESACIAGCTTGPLACEAVACFLCMALASGPFSSSACSSCSPANTLSGLLTSWGKASVGRPWMVSKVR